MLRIVQSVREFLTGTKGEADIPNISTEAAPAAAGVVRKRSRDADGISAASASGTSDHVRKLRCRENLLLVANKDFTKAIGIWKASEKEFNARLAKEKASTAALAKVRSASHFNVRRDVP
jgi:hypothetical protein